MTTAQKAQKYDEYIQIVDRLLRENSKLKATYVADIPPHIQKIIDENSRKIAFYEAETMKLFKD